MIYKTASYELLAVIALLLFIGIAPLPYGYYTFMRIIVCGCTTYMTYRLFSNNEKSIWTWVLGFIAILFNPIVVIHMTKEVWIAVDAITGIFFTTLAYKSYVYQKGKRDE